MYLGEERVTSLIRNLFFRTFSIPMATYVHVFSDCLKFVLIITENMHDMYNLNGVVTFITLLLIK